MKTEQLTLEYLEQMTDPTKFKSFQVRLKDSALAKIKLRRSATYTVQSVQKPSKVFKTYQLHIGRNWYNADMFRLVTEQEETIDLSTYKAFPKGYKIPKGIKVIVINSEKRLGQIGTTTECSKNPIVEMANNFFTVIFSGEYLAPLNPSDHPDYQPDHSVTDQFQPEPIHSDNATVKTLIQYVSEHRDSMSKDSILHFASLIGLIKLGAL